MKKCRQLKTFSKPELSMVEIVAFVLQTNLYNALQLVIMQRFKQWCLDTLCDCKR